MIGCGIASIAAYLPRYRLTAQEIARTQRRPIVQGATRRLAGFDEDALTIAVEAARGLADLAGRVRSLVFCTTTPPYLVKNNASAAHAALGLPEDVPAFDMGGAERSVVGTLLGARPGTLIVTGSVNTARPGAPTELAHGDAGAAVLLGDRDDSIAELVAVESSTKELLDIWRLPEAPVVRGSEERFPVSVYTSLAERVLSRLFMRVSREDIDRVIVSAPSSRVRATLARTAARIAPVVGVEGIGFSGTSDLLVQLCGTLGELGPGQSILVLCLSDGCDAMVFRATDRLAARRPPGLRAVSDGETPTYLDALTWRGLLEREPPRRPEPRPVSPPASARSVSWKYALRGARCGACGAVSSPPQLVCVRCGSVGADPVDLSTRMATIRTFSVDRLAFSPNPPLVAAIVDFDGGGRLEAELTDCVAEELAVGQRVRMTLRRRHSSDGIHNYAWKATREEPMR